MRRPRPHISPAGVVAVGAVIAALAAVLWVLLLVRNEESPIEPSPEVVTSPVSSPPSSPPATVVASPVATFSAVPTVAPGSLPDLMRYAPDRLANGTLPLSDIASYADIERWMTARGITTPTGPEDSSWSAWEHELDVLALPDVLHARGNEAVWKETYGFALTDVHTVLAVGQAPDYVLIMQGDFDAETLSAAWVRSGYQGVRGQGYTIWSLFPGDAVDLSAPASRPALGNLNNIVVLEDGTLIATSRLSRMEETLRVVRDEAPSLGQNAAIAALLAPGAGSESMATAVIVKGALLAADPSTPTARSTPEEKRVPVLPGAGTPVSTPVVERPMPPVGLMLAGIDVPDVPNETPVLSLVVSYETADDATLAMIRVNRNLRQDRSPVTHRSYTDRLDLLTMRVVGTDEDDVVLLIRARPVSGAVDWLAIIDERDLGFLMWPWEP